MMRSNEGRLPWERGRGGSALADIEEVAARIAREAGGLLLDLFHGPLEVEYKDKGQHDPVSQADKRAEEHLRRAIQDRFPEHAILGEEGQDSGPGEAEYTWVLDPLDGTTNYVNGLPLFAVSVGVLRWGHPAVGAIWCSSGPAGGPGVFCARAGGGATLDGAPIAIDGSSAGRARPAQRLAAVPGGSGMLLSFGRPPDGRTGDPRTLGSIAVEAAYVAAGVLQSAVFMAPKIWDVAAGVIIVREAGGSALTRDGKRWHELTSFRRPRDRSGAWRPLRDWRAPIVVAPTPVAVAIAAGMRPTPIARALRVARHPAVRRARRVARRLWREFGPPRGA